MTVTTGDGFHFQDLPGRRSADPLAGTESRSSLRVVELERESGRRAHRHPFSEEVVYVERGSGSVWLDGELHPVSAGDVVHIPAGTPHATIPDSASAMRLVCYFPHPRLADNIEETDIEVTEPGSNA